MRRLVTVSMFTAVCAVVVSCQSAPRVPGATDLAKVGVEQPSHVYCRFLAAGSPAMPTASSTESIKAFWDARRAFEHRALIAAPAEVSADWATVAAFTRDELTPAIEALGYAAVPTISEPDAVSEARVRIAMVDAGCDSPST